MTMPCYHAAAAALTTLLTISLLPATTQATWSISGADSISKQIGAAGASCLDFSILQALYNSVPNRGVVLSQALIGATPGEDPTGPRAISVELLKNKTEPKDILKEIVKYPNPDGDCDVGICSGGYGDACPQYCQDEMVNPMEGCGCCGGETRQYGIATLYGEEEKGASFTGEGVHNQSIAYDGIDGFEDDWVQWWEGVVYTYQGNTVTNGTLANLRSSKKGCDLADDLMIAIEAGAGGEDGTEGDVRCQKDYQSPALGAFLRVERPDGSFVVDFDVVNDTNAIKTLRKEYDKWRVENPCPTDGRPDGDGTNSGKDTSGQVPSSKQYSKWTYLQVSTMVASLYWSWMIFV